MFIQVLTVFTFWACVGGQQQYEETTVEPHPRPYNFAFTAGRYPGNIDRTRAEYGDSNGIVRGLYTYIDPRHEIRTVQYTADKDGFHPILNKPAEIDTPAVADARSRHFKLFNQIAQNNLVSQNNVVSGPPQTVSVADETRKHLQLYAQIAAEHARIAAARADEAEREEYYQRENVVA